MQGALRVQAGFGTQWGPWAARVAGRSRGRGTDPGVALGGRACQVSRDLCTSLEPRLRSSRSELRAHRPSPGRSRSGEGGGGLGVLVT